MGKQKNVIFPNALRVRTEFRLVTCSCMALFDVTVVLSIFLIDAGSDNAAINTTLKPQSAVFLYIQTGALMILVICLFTTSSSESELDWDNKTPNSED